MSAPLTVIIPTYRRVNHQKTLRHMPDEWKRNTILVVDKEDSQQFRDVRFEQTEGVKLHVHPKSIKTIAQKRAYILDEMSSKLNLRKIIMLDDDLRICMRKYGEGKDGGTLVATATHGEVARMFRLIEKKLDSFAHVGIGARAGDNQVEKTQRTRLADQNLKGKELRQALRWFPNFRMMYALGYQTKVLRKECVLGRIEHREDMDYCLQLLRKGYQNRILVEYTVDQLYNTVGGASVDRKTKDSNYDADKLAALHKGFVKVVEKDYKVSVPRKEVICYWKKAYESSQR